MSRSLSDTAAAIFRMLPLERPLTSGLVRPYCFRGRPFVSAWATSPEQLMRGLAAGDGRDAYIQLNAARRVGFRPRSEDVPYIQAILVDLDPLEDYTTETDALRALFTLEALGVNKDQTAHIYSGRGRQLWVLIDCAPTQLATRIPAFLRHIEAEAGLRSCRVDLACTDLPRLARAPGTRNTKTGSMARIVTEARPGGWDWLYQFPEHIPVKYDGPKMESSRWFEYLPMLSLTAQRFLTLGAEEGSRHAAAFATAASLLDCGAEPAVVWEALCWSAELMSFMQDYGGAECLGEADLRHTLNTAMRRQSRANPSS